jgi:hypothetical protein
MALGKNSGSRRWLVVVLLCVVICWQASALALLHHQHGATEHCCLLCHTGPLPLLQAALPSAVAPLLWAAWFSATPEFEGTYDALISTSSSRAPPTGFALRNPGGLVSA